MRHIEFYVTASGRCPVKDFLDGLPAERARKVWKVLDAVRQMDAVPAQYLKKLPGTDDLWEVRVQHGGDAFRLLGFWEGARLIVLVSGFAKKTDEVPRHEIDVAQRRRRDYRERKRKDG